jgi:hydrogenase nickel incorporation protein HypA/HybF
MHELPVIKSILDICLKHAATHSVKRVMAIHLEVGEMSDLEDQWMQRYFNFISKGSIAEGARLLIKRLPVVMQCGNCKTSFQIDIKAKKDIKCPKCDTAEKLSLISGREYKIINMEAI